MTNEEGIGAGLFNKAVIIGVVIAFAVELIAGTTIRVMRDYISPFFPFLLGILILIVVIYYYRKKRWFAT